MAQGRTYRCSLGSRQLCHIGAGSCLLAFDCPHRSAGKEPENMIEKTSCGEASFGVQRPLFNGRLEKWSDVDTAPCSRRSLQSWGHWFMLENRGTSTVVGQGHSSAASNGTLSRHPSSFAARAPIANRSPARAGNKRLLLPSLETPAFEIKPTAAAFGWQTWWWRLF